MQAKGTRPTRVSKNTADAEPPTANPKKQRGVPLTDETYGVLVSLRGLWGLDGVEEVIDRLIEENEIAAQARELRRRSHK